MKFLICDDHPLFREGVALMLSELDRSVDLLEAGDGIEALALAEAHADLDLVLLDLQMPGMDGWNGLSRLRSVCPALPVVILSASESSLDAQRAIDAGAAGFVPKSTRGPVLRAALGLILEGGVYVPPHLVGTAPPEAERLQTNASEGPRNERSERVASLTPKQLEVLRLMARGLRNAEIAAVLGTSLSTVKTHVGAILIALDASNRTEAALVMRELGLDREA